ncbi:MAG: hypothetical protein HY355_06465 [Armatimonadetes bacterium]|nr:hypothetical protein [Armatimonadota bacterium]
MRLTSRTRPRHDPRTIYEIHADRASGMTAAEIAEKRSLPAMTVVGMLRRAVETCTLRSPYEFHQAARSAMGAVHVYWLGFIAACGRVLGTSQLSLVMAIHPQDAEHIQLLLQDLIIGHARLEFADSNLHGRQAYVRDTHLAEMLLQWGISATPDEGSVPVEFIPQALVPDFVRGYLEGSRYSSPFGGQGRQLPSPRGLRSLVLVGPAALLGGLNRALQATCGVAEGVLKPFEQFGLSQLVFSSGDGVKILKKAYARPIRSLPRAAKFVAQFGLQESGQPQKSP